MPTKEPGEDYSTKPQPTIEGFLGWAFDEYRKLDSKKPGRLATEMIEDWLKRNDDLLVKHNITRARFKQEVGGGAVVTNIESKRPR